MASQGGLEENASFLISCIGISNGVSRILFGWISDFPSVNLLVFTMATLLTGEFRESYYEFQPGSFPQN